MSTKGKPKHKPRGKGLLSAVDIVIENTMAKHYDEDLTKHEISSLCEKFLPDAWIDKVLADALPTAIADRLRSAKMTDARGNDIRRFGSYTVAFQDDAGHERLYHCWKSWKHMDSGQQKQALQAQINRATNNVRSVKNLVDYVNKELRRSMGLKPLKLRWDSLKQSIE